MLAKKYRLTRAIRAGKVRKTFSSAVHLISTTTTLLHPRFLFVVSKRVDKRAVVRNKIKRSLGVCIKDILSNIAPGNDIVIRVQKKLGANDTPSLCDQVRELLKKQQLYI